MAVTAQILGNTLVTRWMLLVLPSPISLLTEPELEDETDEIDKSDCITPQNILSLQLALAEDDKESLCLTEEELEHNISETIFMVTFEGDKDRNCDL